jgi:hypothetical protein
MNGNYSICANVATTTELLNITFPYPDLSYFKFVYKDTTSLVIDGKIIVLNDTILLKDQTNKVNNGVYECISINIIGPDIVYLFCRTNDSLFLNKCDYVFIEEGIINKDIPFVFTTDDDILTIGVSELNFIGVKSTNSGGGNPTSEILMLNSSSISPDADVDITELYINSGNSTGTLSNPTSPFIGKEKKIIVTSFTAGSYLLTVTTFVNGSTIEFSFPIQ